MDEKAKILIVDDNRKNLEILSLLFKYKEYNIILAHGGESALEILKAENIDLILLDVMMPHIDGYELCLKIRRHQELKDIPIIFLTAKADETDVLKGFETGGQDYITKPFNTRELLARVNTQLELKQKKDELKTLNETLEKKVQERTFELEKANEKLLLLDEAKIDFLGIISHELRTPLNGIKGFSELLKLLNKSETHRKYFDILDQSINRLVEFSELALDIISLKLRQYNLKYSKNKIKDNINSSLKYYEELILAKHLTINMKNISTDISLCGDKGLIKRVFHIILGNAITHTKPNSTVTISYKKHETNHVYTISDRGSGFSDELLKSDIKLFSAGKKHYDLNMGLNLAFANLIVIAHNGKLKLNNNKSVGGNVEISFPVTPLNCA